jgi:hypothetical protein
MINNLRMQLKQRELSRQNLEEEQEQLDALQREDKTHLEGRLQHQSRRFGKSLENMEQEKSWFEELRLKDQATMEDLWGELRKIKNSSERFELDRNRTDQLLEESENKLIE